MPRKQTRGNVRNRKMGLLDEKEVQKIVALQELGLKYLEAELDILRNTEGNFKEVIQIVAALERIRASRSGEPPAPPSPRDNFSLEFDEPGQERSRSG